MIRQYKSTSNTINPPKKFYKHNNILLENTLKPKKAYSIKAGY